MQQVLTRPARRGALAPNVPFATYGAGPVVAPPFDLIHHAFEEQARLRPDAIAVRHLGETITYGELDRRADQLAWLLTEHGVAVGDRVGLFVRRSIPMVVGILGVLKAGAAYVPQDLRITPPQHLRHIIDTASTRVILTLSEFAGQIPRSEGHAVITLDTLIRERPARALGSPRRPSVSTADTAVVIFTSGTTGRPNGVCVTHSNLCNMLLNEPGSLGVRPGMNVAQILNIAFDMAVWEILGALSHGATLVVRGRDIATTVRTVDVVIATPSILGSLDAARCSNVQVAAVAGERCPQQLADAWSAFSRFYNSCGPTEVTIVNTLQRYTPGVSDLTIGRPLPNTTVYVLDDDLNPCALGEVGEMWAGGACVTAGYLANDELTNERYRPDAFLGGGGRMFRTRDLGRWTASGELEHHGRTDDQVKVRSFRVELDAVNAALELAEGCRQAATMLHEGELVAFVSPATVDPDVARRAVERSLPYYCVPSLVLPREILPLTDRGKVDKQLLATSIERVAVPA